MTIAKQSLLNAAKAVLNQYGKDKSYLSVDIDGDVIQALRIAVSEAETYTPLTDDNRRKIMQEFIEGACSYKTLALNVERAVIERLGLRWPTPPAPDKP
jgi:uncharacterized protein (DUF4213/DUF364 family)